MYEFLYFDSLKVKKVYSKEFDIRNLYTSYSAQLLESITSGITVFPKWHASSILSFLPT
jgi:hypothetical protein